MEHISWGDRRLERDDARRRSRRWQRSFRHASTATAFVVVATLGAAAWVRPRTDETSEGGRQFDDEANGNNDPLDAGPREYVWGSSCSANDTDGTAGSEEDGAGSLDGHRFIPSNISFADLAAAMVPPYFRRTIELCLSTIVPANETNETLSNNREDGDDGVQPTTSIMPGEVCLLRKTVLMTRNLFDAFSPVYSPDDYSNETTEPSKDASMWEALHDRLNHGYWLLGHFQDLDHANITYTPEQLAGYQHQVRMWRDAFTSFEEEHRRDIRSYLSLPCKDWKNDEDEECKYVHSNSSHLFWKNVSGDELPDGSEGATSALWRLGRIQLDRAQRYLSEALACDRVIVRTTMPGGNVTLDDGPHDKYHNFRKELRSFVDEVDLFGRLLLPSSSLIPEIERGRIEVVSRNNFTLLGQASISPALKLTYEAIASLDRARDILGDLNDDYVAYSNYFEWNMYPEEQARLEEEVESRWAYFRNWTHEVGLFAKIQFLRDGMDPDSNHDDGDGEEEDDGEEEEESEPTVDVKSAV